MWLLQAFEKELLLERQELLQALAGGNHSDLYSVGKLQGQVAGIDKALDILKALLTTDDERQSNL